MHSRKAAKLIPKKPRNSGLAEQMRSAAAYQLLKGPSRRLAEHLSADTGPTKYRRSGVRRLDGWENHGGAF